MRPLQKAYKLAASLIAISSAPALHRIHADAFSRHAGTCGSGAAIARDGAGVAPHGGSEANPLPLDIAEIVLTLDDGLGNPPVTLDTAKNSTINAGVPYTLRISRDGGQTFRGFLVRLSDRSGSGQDLAGSLFSASMISSVRVLFNGVVETVATFEDPPICAPGVSAVCHNDGQNDKNEVSILLGVNSPGQLQLEVTIVVNSMAGQWGFSTFNIDAATPEPDPTASPVLPKRLDESEDRMVSHKHVWMVFVGVGCLGQLASTCLKKRKTMVRQAIS